MAVRPIWSGLRIRWGERALGFRLWALAFDFGFDFGLGTGYWVLDAVH